MNFLLQYLNKLLPRLACGILISCPAVDPVYANPHFQIPPNSTLTSAEIMVRGRVTDANGPLEGVTISEKGKSKATTSDANGFYVLSVTGPDATLVFSFIGYQSSELPLAGRTVLNITL
jgi:hypothetical protein